MYVRGNGPNYRQHLQNRGLMALFFFKWNRYYVSLTEANLLIFEKRSTVTPYLSIPLNDIVGLEVVHGEQRPLKHIYPTISNMQVQSDNHDLVVVTTYNDKLHLRLVFHNIDQFLL